MPSALGSPLGLRGPGTESRPAPKGTAMNPYQPTTREHQMAIAILAHTTRRDSHAITVSLNMLAESPNDLRPLSIIAALITEFQLGMDGDGVAVAQQFSNRALSLAAAEAAEREE